MNDAENWRKEFQQPTEYLTVFRFLINSRHSIFLQHQNIFADSNVRHFVDVATKDRILEKIKAISLRFPNILIVPGTIAWKKPMKESGVFGKNRSKKAHRRWDAMSQIHTTGYSNYKQHKDRLQDAEIRHTWYAQNTAYLFKAGKIVLKYHKTADGGEVFKKDREDDMVV